jgi:flagellar basal-body rod modification protein FlgD
MTITPSSTLLQTPPNERLTSKNLSQQDFIKILMTQLQNQDPTKPQDSSSMINQMGQINSIQSMMSMQQSLTDFRMDQKITLGQSLINKTVKVADPDLGTATGKVTEVGISGKDILLKINNQSWNLDTLQSVLDNA